MANSASMAPERNIAVFEAFNKEEAVPDASDCSGATCLGELSTNTGRISYSSRELP